MRQFRQPCLQSLQRRLFERTQVRQHFFRFRIIPLAQLGDQLQQPRQSVGPLEVRPPFSAQICGLLLQVFGGQTLPQRLARRFGERRLGKFPRQPDEQPMSMHGGMPVVAAEKAGVSLRGGRDIGVAVQHMADLVRIFLVDAAPGRDSRTVPRPRRRTSETGFSAAAAIDRKQQQHRDESLHHAFRIAWLGLANVQAPALPAALQLSFGLNGTGSPPRLR